jgi:hypothetical protein
MIPSLGSPCHDGQVSLHKIAYLERDTVGILKNVMSCGFVKHFTTHTVEGTFETIFGKRIQLFELECFLSNQGTLLDV